MAVQFQIDGGNMPLDPYDVAWDAHQTLGLKFSGGPLYSGYRTCKLQMDAMSLSDFTTLEAKCDTATHTAKIPAPGSGTYTTYSSVFIRLSQPVKFQDVHVEPFEIEIWHVSV